MLKTISFINLKGGVGKTTVSVNLAYFLAEKLNAKVLFIDNDKQGNASQFFEADTDLSLADLLMQAAATADVVKKTRYKNIDIIPADMSLASANFAVLQNTEIEQHKILDKALTSVQNSYDICIIDNPPDINLSVLNALIVTDEIIVVTVPDEYSGHGIDEMKNQIQLAKQYNPNLIYRGCVFNKMSGSSTSLYYRGLIEENHPIFHTSLHYSKDWLNTTTQKKLSIFELSPRCRFARDMKNFIAELLR